MKAMAPTMRAKPPTRTDSMGFKESSRGARISCGRSPPRATLNPVRPEQTEQCRKVDPWAATDEDRDALLLVDAPGVAGVGGERHLVPVLLPALDRPAHDDDHVGAPLARPPQMKSPCRLIG